MGRKIDFYQERAESTFWDLIPLAQLRLSLMSIFGLTDRITLNTQKAKKVKNLLYVAIDKIKEDNRKIEKLEKDNSKLLQRIAILEKKNK